MISIIMFFAALIMLLFGFLLHFTFASVSLLFGIAGVIEVGFENGGSLMLLH